MSDRWHIKLAGKIYHSTETEKIRQFIIKLKRENRLPDNIPVMPPGSKTWVSIKDLPEFKALFHIKKDTTLELSDAPGLTPSKTPDKKEPVPGKQKKPAAGKHACPQCGYENAPDAPYCSMCSEPFKKEQKQHNKQTVTEPAVPPKPAKKQFRIIPLVIIIICIAVGYNLFKRSGGTGTATVTHKKSSSEKEYEARIQELIDNGTDLNEAQKDGRPYLVWAVEFEYVDAVNMLLENGADPDTAPDERADWTMLFEAITDTNHPDDDPTPTRTIAELLIQYGADVNYKIGNLMETPLYKAATVGRTDLCRLFIENGADVSFPDALGQTPLHAAAKNGYYDVVQLLLENGADPNAVNKMGETPMSYAEQREEEDYYNRVRKKAKGSFPGADYDRVIELLNQ